MTCFGSPSIKIFQFWHMGFVRIFKREPFPGVGGCSRLRTAYKNSRQFADAVAKPSSTAARMRACLSLMADRWLLTGTVSDTKHSAVPVTWPKAGGCCSRDASPVNEAGTEPGGTRRGGRGGGMAHLGQEVRGIDTDERRIRLITAGTAAFLEPGLGDILTSMLATGRLRFSTSVADAAEAEVHFLAVGTPQSAESTAADLSYVDGAFEALLPHLAPGALVVGKSTVPVGTAARLAEWLARDA